MITYEQWNKAIISYFFENCEPGQIVFLQTNAETLGEIAELSNFNVVDAAESLIMAVRRKAVVSDKVNFRAVNPTVWKDYSKEEPPQVAFLALTVFAASLMESEGSVAANNYYSRLNEVLFGEVIKGTPQGFQRPKFEYFWIQLQSWAIDQHNVVLYLTEGSSKRRYVWYPISQCLISNRDRRNVYRFFRAHDLTPFSKIQDKQLEKDLQVWLQSSDGSAKIKRYFSNESYKKSILSQVKSLLKHWDGEIPPEPTYGERQATASVNVEIRFNPFDNNAEIRYWFPRRGRNEIHCKTNSLEVQYLRPSHLEKWFQPVIDNKRTFWNRNLLHRLQVETVETNSITYTFGLSDVWVFREDERVNGWLSQRSMQLHEDHLIVFRKRFLSQVMDCLKESCEQEIEKANPIHVEGKENDWLYLFRIKPTKSVPVSDQKLWRLSVVSGERISFIGGLSVRDRNDRKAYLDICLPTVFVPNLGLSEQESLRIEERTFRVSKDRFVTLDNALTPGFHLLTYGKETKELRVISLERSLEHHNQTLIAAIPEGRATMPAYTVKEISEISKEPGIWLTGAKLLGNIPDDSPPIDDEFFKVPAHIISSVVQVAINAKLGKDSVPEWFDEVIEYLDQNVPIRALVEKKLNLHHKTALSYTELRKQIGK